MIPSTFDYEVAESAEHAVTLLGSREDAKLLAGGHSLIPLLRLRFARPSLLVDIGRIAEPPRARRGRVARDRGADAVQGAPGRPADPGALPVSHTAGLVGDPQVRHRGTIGGSLAHCDPASDFPAVISPSGPS